MNTSSISRKAGTACTAHPCAHKARACGHGRAPHLAAEKVVISLSVVCCCCDDTSASSRLPAAMSLLSVVLGAPADASATAVEVVDKAAKSSACGCWQRTLVNTVTDLERSELTEREPQAGIHATTQQQIYNSSTTCRTRTFTIS
jgi:hypothetical protein